MPFKSEKQRKYMWANEPKIAERWTKKYGSKPQGKKKGSSLLNAYKNGKKKMGR